MTLYGVQSKNPKDTETLPRREGDRLEPAQRPGRIQKTLKQFSVHVVGREGGLACSERRIQKTLKHVFPIQAAIPKYPQSPKNPKDTETHEGLRRGRRNRGLRLGAKNPKDTETRLIDSKTIFGLNDHDKPHRNKPERGKHLHLPWPGKRELKVHLNGKRPITEVKKSRGRGGEKKRESEEERIRRACVFEEKMLARGMGLDDLNYYTLPFHESEACETLDDEELCEELLEGARL